MDWNYIGDISPIGKIMNIGISKMSLGSMAMAGAVTIFVSLGYIQLQNTIIMHGDINIEQSKKIIQLDLSLRAVKKQIVQIELEIINYRISRWQ